MLMLGVAGVRVLSTVGTRGNLRIRPLHSFQSLRVAGYGGHNRHHLLVAVLVVVDVFAVLPNIVLEYVIVYRAKRRRRQGLLGRRFNLGFPSFCSLSAAGIYERVVVHAHRRVDGKEVTHEDDRLLGQHPFSNIVTL